MKQLIKILNIFFSKKSKKIIFKSVPDYSGNALAFYLYMQENHKDYELIWLTDKEDNRENSFKKNSFKGIYHYMTSKYIFTTHNEMITTKVPNQKYISAWHGIPMKKIGFLREEFKKGEEVSCDRIATSELTRSLIAASFHEIPKNVHITGQPRNDFLYEDFNLEKIGIKYKAYKKIIFYMPTFRQNQYGKTEGEKIEGNNFFRFSEYDHKKFLKILKNENIMFILKLHPFEEKYLNNVEESLNFKILTTEEVNKKQIDVNQILSKVDILLTDYSSVYLDFLILNRPIGFIIPDLDKYSASRSGFALEPFDYWTPGEKIKNFMQFEIFLDKILKNEDNYKIKREEVNKIINRYSDNKNSERVYKKIIEMKVEQ